MTRLRTIIATAGGIGFAPVASGTFGSVPGVALVWLLARIGGSLATSIGFVVVTALGFWSAGVGEKLYGRKDPGQIVIDEVAGQMLALLFVPLNARTMFAGFFLFRLMDVLKPFPARALEALPGGSGIMADDLMAAVYANLLLQLLVWTLPGWLGVG